MKATVVGDSFSNTPVSRPWRTPWVFGAGFLTGLLVAAAIVELRPVLQAMWSQKAPMVGTSPDDTAEGLPAAALTQAMGDLAPYFTVVQAASLTQARLEMEATAEANFKRAKELAIQGIATRDAGREDGEETLAELQQQEYLWAAAMRQIDQIPPESILAEAAAEKRTEYAAIMAPVARDVDRLQSSFLAEIAEATGRPRAIRVTICHLAGECRDYKGDVPPASPASLIKVPVALVLMHKVATENIDLEEPVYIDPRNWTETADGEGVFVRQEYPLGVVMHRMINESNNIATNQLADYLGWDYLQATLAELGYDQTKVRTKLVGDRTIPTYNRRVGTNVMTT
ncbi:MAG TPA: serine hydrolase, partial [Candidatus Obscuribacterales bacterium]